MGLKWTAYAATAGAFGLGLWQKWPCQSAGWQVGPTVALGHRCYSDIPALYSAYHLDAHQSLFAQGFEYPVLTGYLANALAWLASGAGAYFLLNVIVLLACALVLVWAVIALSGRTSAGLIVALSPILVLSGTINWDLLVSMFVVLALLAWQRELYGFAGVALGLGTAAKFYPALLLFPMAIVALRSRTWRPYASTVIAATITWAIVNLPIVLLYPQGWARFWTLNANRGADLGSAYPAAQILGHPVGHLNLAGMLTLAVLLVLIGWYGLRMRPDLASLALLTVAAFLVTNKVYSPQYALWLLPLAVVAGVRLRVIVVWQAAEVAYWFAVWAVLNQSISQQAYAYVLCGRIAAEILLCTAVTGIVPAGRLVPRVTDTPKMPEAAKFAAVGVANTAISFTVFNLALFTFLPHSPLKANVFANIVATAGAFVMHRYWTYRDRPRHHPYRQITIFVLCNLGGLGIELLTLAVAKFGLGITSLAGINIAKAAGLVLGLMFRHVTYRTLVFAAGPVNRAHEYRLASGPPAVAGRTHLSKPLA